MVGEVDQIQGIFLAALEQPETERAAFLDEQCGIDTPRRQRVEELLAAHPGSDSLLDLTSPLLPEISVPWLLRPGSDIGPYKLLEEIGHGGMGVVYLAEQSTPVRRRVALKVIKPGMDSRSVISRFEAERQVLSLMDHPHIAKVFDGGTIGEGVKNQGSGVGERGAANLTPDSCLLTPGFGLPYFVMELVQGRPITQYCDEHRLSLRERIALFIPVCQAIQHAHQKGIIHRDIKPTNVLVAEGDERPLPKVIDFGVAKALDQPLNDNTLFTGMGQIVGTLEYLSPEQAEGNRADIDTRSDVYSLGVLLYELLSGTTPFEPRRLRSAAFDEMLRIVREEEPPRPSTRLSSHDSLPLAASNRQSDPAKLSGLLRGELDWVVMKTLEKDRSRRYESANALAADLQRYLADEAVQACPPSRRYRVGKFVRRYKGLVASISLIAATLLLSTIVSTSLALRAMRAEEQAASDLERALKAEESAVKESTRAKEEAERARRSFERADRNFERLLSAAHDLSGAMQETILQQPPDLADAIKSRTREWQRKILEDSLVTESDDPYVRHDLARGWLLLSKYTEIPDERVAYAESGNAILAHLVREFPNNVDFKRSFALSCGALVNASTYLTKEKSLAYTRAAHDAWRDVVSKTNDIEDKLAYIKQLQTVPSNFYFPAEEQLENRQNALRVIASLAAPNTHNGLEQKLQAMTGIVRDHDLLGHTAAAKEQRDKLAEVITTIISANKELPPPVLKALVKASDDSIWDSTPQQALSLSKLVVNTLEGHGHGALAPHYLKLGRRYLEVDDRDGAKTALKQAITAYETTKSSNQPIQNAMGPTSAFLLKEVDPMIARYLLTTLVTPQQQLEISRDIHNALIEMSATQPPGRAGGQPRSETFSFNFAWSHTALAVLLVELQADKEAEVEIERAVTLVEGIAEASFQDVYIGGTAFSAYWSDLRHMGITAALFADIERVLRALHRSADADRFRAKLQQTARELLLGGSGWGNWQDMNGFAWHLCVSPDSDGESVAQALHLGEQAATQLTKVEMSVASYLKSRPIGVRTVQSKAMRRKFHDVSNTIAMALYRSGRFSDSAQMVERGISIGGEESCHDNLLLAMARWQLAQPDEARQSFDKAVNAMEKEAPLNVELRAIRREAAALLKIEDTEP